VESGYTAVRRWWAGRSSWQGGAQRRGRVDGAGREHHHERWSRVSVLISTGPIQGRAGAGPTQRAPAASDGGLSAAEAAAAWGAEVVAAERRKNSK
jgi:hypothetical protein